jgi:hypothetical protein
LPRLREIYGERTAVYATAEHGATTFEISAEGQLRARPLRPRVEGSGNRN